MTEELFREDAYSRTCEAVVTAADARGIQLDRSVFYPMGGGQPGDSGTLNTADGDRVTAEIDWDRRYRLMRMHTCLHLLCAVVPGAVTGGSVGEAKGRLDFDIPEPTLDKEAIEADLNRLIAEDRAVSFSWITDDELAANPDLVRTMSVQPPSGQGRVRVINVDGADLQPCGGTHVRSTGEIGPVRLGKIEKKGRQNRRVNVHFDE